MTTITKGNWCRLLFQRIDKAIADGFFLEATFIISGIIDDRLKSTITILDSTYSTRETMDLSRILCKLKLDMSGYSLAI